MALANVRDMSVIETPPQERLPIRTYIREFDDDLIREVILREIDRGGQVFFVHNRVQGIQTLARASCGGSCRRRSSASGTGRWPRTQLEQVMLDFASGETNVLVCTTIIENGLDIPNANTIIVNNAAHLRPGAALPVARARRARARIRPTPTSSTTRTPSSRRSPSGGCARSSRRPS